MQPDRTTEQRRKRVLTSVYFSHIARGAAMEVYIAQNYPPGYDFPISTISTLFWGATIFVALFVVCVLTWKTIEWLRDREKFGSEVAGGGLPEVPEGPSEAWATQAISRPSGDYHYWEMGSFGGLGGLEGMSQREQEELFSTYAPRKVRKAMRARRRAREIARRSKGSS
jgi:hypothetical protein